MGTSREIKVGAFVLIGLMVVGLVVFLIGDESAMFQRHTTFRTSFEDVQGLTRGSPVRMGGVGVGKVDSIGYASEASDPTIYVEFSIVETEARRIRADSVATIEAKGLLGDKMLVVSVGSPDKPALEPGALIPSESPRDMTAIVGDVAQVAAGAEKVISNLERTTAALAEDEFHKDIKDSVAHLSGVLHSLESGDGYLARLLRDGEEAERLSRVVANLERASARLDGLLGSAQSVADRVRTGPGFAHEVIYGEDGAKALAQVGGAAEELGLTLRGVREGHGLARGILYGDEGSDQLMGNLNQMSADLRDIVADLKGGKGTLGALLSDPSVYEDVKMLLGNVGRNRSLRALVRYSIQRDEVSPSPPTDAAAPASGSSAVTSEAAGQ
ncbi:MAG: MCE family protein [Myxococcales bacterium]|nr:MCE family protein [Myxococcales bacterium]